MSSKSWIWLSCIAAALAAGGCSTFGDSKTGWDWKNPLSKKQPEVQESAYGRPARMAVIWTPDVLTVPGKPPTRGFGGRIYFYNNEDKAIPVDGQLIVYGYDDTDPQKAHTVPDRRFGFTPEQFTQHFTPTEIGASYSIWIPWDTGESQYRAVSLVPVFTSTNGHRVIGQPSINVLQGPKPDFLVEREERRQRELSMRVEEVETDAGTHPTTYAELMAARERRRARTTTITLPQTMAKRMANAPVVPEQATSPVMTAGAPPPQATGYPAAPHASGPVAAAGFSAPDPGSLPAHSGHRVHPAPARLSEPVTHDPAGWQRHQSEQQWPHPFSRQPGPSR